MVSFSQALKILQNKVPAEIKEGVCQCCGSTKDVTYEPDPYAEEIDHDDSSVWECAACREQSGRDI